MDINPNTIECHFEVNQINTIRVLKYLLNPIPEKELINHIKQPKTKLYYKFNFSI